MSELRFLQIEPTTRCNFTCGFCAGRYMEQADLDFALFEALVSQSPGLEHVELQGEGEPLMHPRFLEMVALLRGRGIKVSFISNGSYLHKEMIDKLLDLGIEKISVSLESADPAAFRHIRGGKLEKVLRGISELLEERNRRGLERPVVGFSITVLRDTRAELSPILSLYRSLGLDGGVTVQPLSAMPDYLKHYPAAMRAQALSETEVSDLWVQHVTNRELRSIQRTRKHAKVRGFYEELFAKFRTGGRSCPWLDSGVYVNFRGEASPCCMVKDTAQHGFGTVGTQPMSEILQARERLREQLGRGELPAACAGCELGRFAVMSFWESLSFGVRGVLRRCLAALRPSRRPRRVALPVVR